MTHVLLDTNVLIDIYRNRREALEMLYEIPNPVFHISIVTYTEFLTGVKSAFKPKARKFLGNFSLKEFDSKCHAVLKIEAFRYSLPKNQTADFLIAVTALTHNYILVTENVRHFKIKGLQLHKYKG